MAYNKGNHFRRVLKVQAIAIEKQALGIMQKRIFEDYIEEQFNISYRTYSKYLGINAKRELRKLNERLEEQKQMSLFGSDLKKEDEEIQ